MKKILIIGIIMTIVGIFLVSLSFYKVNSDLKKAQKIIQEIEIEENVNNIFNRLIDFKEDYDVFSITFSIDTDFEGDSYEIYLFDGEAFGFTNNITLRESSLEDLIIEFEKLIIYLEQFQQED